MDPETTTTNSYVQSVPIPILPPKRKRGRPRKVPAATMDLFTETALDEIRGALGIEHLNSPHVVDVVSIDPIEDSIPPILPEPQSTEPLPATTSSPEKRSRGRPRKHPLPVADTGPAIKRKRGRPRTVPITELAPTELESECLMTESVNDNTPYVVPTVMLVPPPELVPEPTQVNIAQVPASSNINPDQAEVPLPVIPIVPPSVGGLDLPHPDSPIKKKRGRPRKNPPPDPNAEKRKRGRPRKSSLPTSPGKKRGPGRPRKNPDDIETENSIPAHQPVMKELQKRSPEPVNTLPSVSASVPPKASVGEGTGILVKKGPGRPKKQPKSTGTVEKRPRGRPRIHPKPENDEPVVKRKRGRPRKEPIAINVSKESKSISDQDFPPKRKRGRPKKNPVATMTVIPAQSSEPIDLALSFPAVSPETSFGEDQVLLNVSSDISKPSNEAFQLMLSSDSENANYSNLSYAMATLNKGSNKGSPLLDDRFVESSDEDD